MIAFKLIDDSPYEYQIHLEGISDYLLDQIKWWEETDHGVMFYDIKDNQTNEAIKVKIHHFWSYSLKEEWERTKKIATKLYLKWGFNICKKDQILSWKQCKGHGIIKDFELLSGEWIRHIKQYVESSTRNRRSHY